MRRKLIFNLVATFVVLIVVGVAMTFAWYTNTSKSSSMDYISNGLVISYKIEDEVDVKEYNVENVVFFDVDSEKEGKYFTDAAVEVTLEISNYSTTPINFTVMQSIQPFTMSNTIESNVLTIYKYTKDDTVTRKTTFTANTYYTFTNEGGYKAETKYAAGNVYYTKEAYITATLTAENNKLTSVVSKDSSNKTLITKLDEAGTSFIVGDYQEATGLTKAAFNAGVYYTLKNSTYTQAKVFDESTTYYEVNTMAYVGRLTISGTTVSKADITTTGAYVACVISDTKLNSGSFTGSVNSYIATNSLTNDYSTSTPLAASTAHNTAGGKKTVYLYVFGIQPFDGATSNFLENSRNDYPFSLIIIANQA